MSRIVNKMSRLVVILSVALGDIALQQRNQHQRDYKFYFFHLCVSSHSTTLTLTHTHTHTHPFNGHFSGTTQVSRYQKGKTNLDFNEARE